MPTPKPPASILDLPEVSGEYFSPQDRRIVEPFVVNVNGTQLNCFHHVVASQNLTLVHFHGNGEAVADYLPDMADELANLGLNSLFVEYRQYGGSKGKACLVAMLGDGEAAVAAAGLVPERTLVMGRSMGSLYAIELVHRQSRIAGLIIESGIASASDIDYVPID
jgi:alpha-beta hydrolase superfamily lysophospholipase